MFHSKMMDEKLLREIGILFVYIRGHAFPKNESSLKDYLVQMEGKRDLINNSATPFQKEIFNYCFDSLKELFEKRQYETMFDFVDAVHNLPEIFYREYNLESFWIIYIEPLRIKHGRYFFSDFQYFFVGMNF